MRFASLHDRVAEDELVWNAHVHVESESALGTFWGLLAELAWRDYFDDPRTTSFGEEDFDRFPKGTTCFLAPREVLLAAFSAFRTRYRDARLANDDTPILEPWPRARASESRRASRAATPRARISAVSSGTRSIVGRSSSTVTGRRSRASSRRSSRFSRSARRWHVAALRRPALAPAALAGSGLAAAAYGLHAGRSRREIAVLATVTPLYAIGHALGMWRGAFELLRGGTAR